MLYRVHITDGQFIKGDLTYEEAKGFIASMEEQDMEEGRYEPGAYEIRQQLVNYN
jgi:hypothetical protein